MNRPAGAFLESFRLSVQRSAPSLGPARSRRAAVSAVCVALSLVTGCKGCSKPEAQIADSGTGDASADASVAARYDLPTSSNPGPEFQKVCYAFAKARCRKLMSCSRLGFDIAEGPETACLGRTTRRCLYDRAPKESGVSLEALAKCTSAIESASCTDVVADTVAACERAPGKIGNGQPCVFDGQCESQFCAREPDEPCGKCEPGRKEGEDCKLGRCGSADGLRCVEGKCVKPRAKGDACASTAECLGNLVCFDGKCSPPSSAGKPCDPAGKDAPDCDAAEGLFCEAQSKTCKPLTVSPEGRECGAAVPHKRCYSDARCVDGRCARMIRTGDPCTKTGPGCSEPAQCIEGRCIIPDVANCVN